MIRFSNSSALMREQEHQHIPHDRPASMLLELLEDVPWGPLTHFLNAVVQMLGGLPQSVEACASQGCFVRTERGLVLRLPEDSPMRWLVWSYFVNGSNMFDDCEDPDERFVETITATKAVRRQLYNTTSSLNVSQIDMVPKSDC